MADFVSRSKVEFELCGGNLPEKYKAFIRRVLNDKALVPAADAVPVVRGRWVDIMLCNAGERIIATCSRCKDRGDVRTAMTEFGFWEIDSPHCPNCGAKMDGGKNNASD